MGTESRKHLYTSLKQLATQSVFKQQLKRLLKSRNRQSCCSHCNCCNNHVDDSNTQYLHPSNDEEELNTNNYIAPPKTPDYCPNEDDDEILNTNEENDSENSPLPSQPRPTQNPPKGHRENRLLMSNKPNSPP